MLMDHLIAGRWWIGMTLDRPVPGFPDTVVYLPALHFVVFEDPTSDFRHLVGLRAWHYRHAIVVGDDDVTRHHQHVPNGDGLIVGLDPHPARINAARRQCGILINGDPREGHFVGIAADFIAYETAQTQSEKRESHVGPAEPVIARLVIDHQNRAGPDEPTVLALILVPSRLPGTFVGMGVEMRRSLLRGHQPHRQGHTMNPMREFLLVAPKRQ